MPNSPLSQKVSYTFLTVVELTFSLISCCPLFERPKRGQKKAPGVRYASQLYTASHQRITLTPGPPFTLIHQSASAVGATCAKRASYVSFGFLFFWNLKKKNKNKHTGAGAVIAGLTTNAYR